LNETKKLKGNHMSECNTTECCQEQEACCCPIEKAVQEGNCPLDAMIDVWKGSFFQAMKETQVDILKEKIRKNWGSMMEKEADAVVSAMGAHWQSIMTKAMAQGELKENFKNILKSAQH
jgi:hypothetical protein